MQLATGKFPQNAAALQGDAGRILFGSHMAAVRLSGESGRGTQKRSSLLLCCEDLSISETKSDQRGVDVNFFAFV